MIYPGTNGIHPNGMFPPKKEDQHGTGDSGNHGCDRGDSCGCGNGSGKSDCEKGRAKE